VTNKLLIINGPHAGQRHALPEGRWAMEIPVYAPDHTSWLDGETPPDSCIFRKEAYETVTIASEDRDGSTHRRTYLTWMDEPWSFAHEVLDALVELVPPADQPT
jgi:hypothetical protein